MRIRRLASKILGMAASLPPPPLSMPVLVDASSDGYFCSLNQSPWDVFFSDDPQELKEVGDVIDSIEGEETMSAVLSTSAMPDDEVKSAYSEESNEIQELHEMKPKPSVKKVNKTKGKKLFVKEGTENIASISHVTSTTFSGTMAMMEDEVVGEPEQLNGLQEEHDNKHKPAMKRVKKAKEKKHIAKKDVEKVESVGPFTCKKTDGKQWQCKRPAEQPNSLCNYHCELHRSYNKKKPKAPAADAVTPKPCDQTQGTDKTPTIVDVNDSSTLGPLQGEQHDGGDLDCAVVEPSEDPSKTEEILECDISNVTDKEDSLEDSEKEEKPKSIKSNPPNKRRKRRRKPVKERSLMSLM